MKVSYKKGDSLFLPAGSGAYVIEGSCDALITTIREKAAPVRIGIDIGGTDTKIGLVDVHRGSDPDYRRDSAGFTGEERNRHGSVCRCGDRRPGYRGS